MEQASITAVLVGALIGIVAGAVPSIISVIGSYGTARQHRRYSRDERKELLYTKLLKAGDSLLSDWRWIFEFFCESDDVTRSLFGQKDLLELYGRARQRKVTVRSLSVRLDTVSSSSVHLAYVRFAKAVDEAGDILWRHVMELPVDLDDEQRVQYRLAGEEVCHLEKWRDELTSGFAQLRAAIRSDLGLD